MKLYFQFFTLKQSAECLDLIQIPALLASDKDVNGVAKISAGGSLRSTKSCETKELCSEIAKTEINEVEVSYEVKELQGGKEKIENLNGVFSPASSSSIWFHSDEFIRGDRASMMRRGNARLRERTLVTYGLSEKPSLFEVVLDLKTRSPESQILDLMAERLIYATEKLSPRLKVFGCCDIGVKDVFVRLEANALALIGVKVTSRLLPSEYPKMDRKFDDLHAIMFGAKNVCAALTGALGKDARLIGGSGSSDFSVIRLDLSCDMASAREKAKEWLLPTIG